MSEQQQPVTLPNHMVWAYQTGSGSRWVSLTDDQEALREEWSDYVRSTLLSGSAWNRWHTGLRDAGLTADQAFNVLMDAIQECQDVALAANAATRTG